MKLSKLLLTAGAVGLATLTVSLGQAGKKVIMGVSIPSADHGWTGGVVYWANRTKAELEKANPNLSVIVKTARDAADQANQLQDLVTVNKINALVILPYESAPLTAPVKAVHDKGVFVTVVDRGLTDPTAQDAYVAGDNPGLGRVSAEYVGRKMNGTGNLVVLRGLPTVIDNQRVDGFEAVLKAKYPGIKILDKKYANWNRDDGFKVMQDYLTRFPRIDGVWAQDDDIAVGVLKAIDQAKRADIKFVLGGAGSKDFVKKVLDGDPLVDADVTYPPRMVQNAMQLTASSQLTGKAMRKSTIIPSVLITKTNAKAYYFPDSPF